MSFDRPGLPHPGHRADEPQIDEDLREEGVDLDEDGHLDGLDHPGEPSSRPAAEPAAPPGPPAPAQRRLNECAPLALP